MNSAKKYRPYALDEQVIPSHMSLQVPLSLSRFSFSYLPCDFRDNFKKSHKLSVCLFPVIIVGEALFLC